jgi:site-specific recombinase XerD
MRYASYRDPAVLPIAQQVLSIPSKCYSRPLLGFLSHEEVEAIILAPDRSTWSGRRDHALLLTLYNSGARVSEITQLRTCALSLEHSHSVCIHAKGRKERSVPLWKNTVSVLKQWLRELGTTTADAPVFPNRYGQQLSRSGVEDRLQSAVKVASRFCPTLAKRKISPHTIRHTTAMHLLQSGVDIVLIALWLGHESPATTHMYVEADLTMKQRALERLQEVPRRSRPHKVSDRILAFLDGL